MGSIEYGKESSLFINSQNEVYGFGRNAYGELGLGDTLEHTIPEKINFQFDGNPIKVSMGFFHQLILTDTGKVYGMGENFKNEIDSSSNNNISTPTLMNYSFNGTPIDIAQGFNTTYVVTDTGSVYSKGQNNNGALGLNDTTDRSDFELITTSMNGNPIKIFAGYETAMIITDTNKLYSFGDGWRGSLGLGDTSDRYIPTEITTNFDGNPIELQLTYSHSIMVTDTGQVYTCGSSAYGQLGHGDQSAKDIFTKINISFNGKPIDVAGGYYHSAIITDTNNAYTFGWNAIGQLGLGDFTDRYSPSIVNYTFNGNLVDVKQGYRFTKIETDTGNIYTVGSNSAGQLGIDGTSSETFVSIDGFGSVPMHTLSLSQDPTNGGVIQVNGQNVTTPYSNDFEENSNVTITQIPNEGYEFDRWEEI